MSHLDALRTSVDHLRSLVEPLDDDAIVGPSYASEWTIAQTMSHLGSGAVIFTRRVDDSLSGTVTPDDFAPSVWDEWNAKSPRAMVDDGLAADAALIARLEATTDDERERFVTTLGPMELRFDQFVAMRLNEHAMHTWDIEVALDPTATLQPEATALVIDNLGLIARFTGKPTGATRMIAIHTTNPDRDFVVELTADAATLALGDGNAAPDIELPAEAFARLVYGRLDPTDGDADAHHELRRVYPGP